MGNFLEYSNLHQVNVIPKESYEELVKEVFDTIAENMTKSLGPLGSSTIIMDGMSPNATKDGFSIFKNIIFHNRYKKMIYNLMRVPCVKLNNTVGDGTTTAIVFSSHLYNEYNNDANIVSQFYKMPRTFTEVWDETISAICDGVEKTATPMDIEKDIYNLCYVTSNGNDEISCNIANVYKETPSAVIRQKDSPTNKSYIKAIKGFEFPTNLIDEAYVTSEDLSTDEKDVAVIIFDHKIESDVCTKFIFALNEVMRAQDKKLVVVAPYYDAYLANTVLKQYVNSEFGRYRKLNLILTQYNLPKLEKDQLKDLGVIVRADVITQEMAAKLVEIATNDRLDAYIDGIERGDFDINSIIGNCQQASLSCTNGSIFHNDDVVGDKRYQEVLTAAKAELNRLKSETDDEKLSYSFKIFKAESRVTQLEMKNYIYYIGADSVLQKQITWDAVEDVIKCVRSAIAYGTVPGCQLSIIKSSANLLIDNAKEINDKYAGDIESAPKEVVLRRFILQWIIGAAAQTYHSVLMGPDRMGLIKLVPLWNKVREDGYDKLVEESKTKFNEILKESLDKYQVFDAETEEYSPNIITSAQTDTMVLRAASELVKILISGNQCLFLDSDINNSHQETQDIYA